MRTVSHAVGRIPDGQMNTTNDREKLTEEDAIKRAVVRLNGHVLGFVLGALASLMIFAATNWLVLKGGEVIGPHLGLLANFFFGYSVSFIGSIIGAVYAFILGYISGLMVGWIYNAVVLFKSSK